MEEFRKEKNESIIEGRNVVIEAFRSGRDFHKYVASLVYGIPVAVRMDRL